MCLKGDSRGKPHCGEGKSLYWRWINEEGFRPDGRRPSGAPNRRGRHAELAACPGTDVQQIEKRFSHPSDMSLRSGKVKPHRPCRLRRCIAGRVQQGARKGANSPARMDRRGQSRMLEHRFQPGPAGAHRASARLVELVDTRDLKSLGPRGLCRFESGSGHHPAVSGCFRMSR